MSWTTPPTIVTGVVVTAAVMNAGYRDNLNVVGGPASAAETIASLNTLWGGTPPDRARGRLRCGSTPFDFVGLVYDLTYTKWVSEQFPVFVPCFEPGGSGSTTIDSFGATWVTNATGGTEYFRDSASLIHKAFTDAGLTLQVRWIGKVYNSGAAGTVTMKAHGVPQNDGDTAAGTDTNVTLLNAVAANTPVYKDSGWVSLAPGTPKTMLTVALGLTGNVAGANNNMGAAGTLHGRWTG